MSKDRNRISRLAMRFVFAFSTVPLLNACTKADCIDFERGAYVKASFLYQTQQYAGSSREFETIARDIASCETVGKTFHTNSQRVVALDLLTSGEASHWAKDDVRARALVLEALKRLNALEPYAKKDDDLEFILYGHSTQAKNDLNGEWTIGLPR